MAGLFIAFEGPEGGGKTMQATRLAGWLRSAGHTVVVSREPGGTTLGRELRRLILDPMGNAILPKTEALLYAADRAEHVDLVLRPALAAGAVVLCDRFVDSSLAYQGVARGLEGDDFRALQRFATGGLEPDLRLLLDLPVRIGLKRRFAEGDGVNRLDAADVSFHERVRAAYRSFAEAAPDAWVVVDAAGDPDAVAGRIAGAVSERLGARLAAATGALGVSSIGGQQ